MSHRACQTIRSHGPITLIHLSDIEVSTFLIAVTNFLVKQFKEGFIFGPLYRGLVHHDRGDMVAGREGMVTGKPCGKEVGSGYKASRPAPSDPLPPQGSTS